jgi:hypothetical protein
MPSSTTVDRSATARSVGDALMECLLLRDGFDRSS